MRHYFDFVPNATTGAAISGAIVKLFDASDNLIDIFADESGTAIETVSGVPNGAKTDSDGMFSLYVENGIYTVRFYVGDKILKTIRNVELSEDVTRTALEATTGAALVGVTGGGTAQQALDARPTSAALAATTGATIIGTQAPGTGTVAETAQDVFDRLPMSPEQFGSEPGDVSTGLGNISTTIGGAIGDVKFGAVNIPRGEYSVPNGLLSQSQGIQIHGVGRSVLTWTGAAGGNMFQVRDGSGWSFDNLVLLGSSVNVPNAAIFLDDTNGIDPTSGDNEFATISRVIVGRRWKQESLLPGYVTKPFKYGVLIDGPNGLNNDSWYIQQCQFHDCSEAGTYISSVQSIWGSSFNCTYDTCKKGFWTGSSTLLVNPSFNRNTECDFVAFRDTQQVVISFNAENSARLISQSIDASITLLGGKALLSNTLMTDAYYAKITQCKNLSLRDFWVAPGTTAGKKIQITASTTQRGDIYMRGCDLPDGQSRVGYELRAPSASGGLLFDIQKGEFRAKGRLDGSVDLAAASIAAGASGLTSFASGVAAGVVAGDPYLVSLSNGLGGLLLCGNAYNANLLFGRLYNETAGAINPGASLYRWRKITTREIKAKASQVYDAPSMPDNTGATLLFDIPCSFDDFVYWGTGLDTRTMFMSAHVKGANQAALRFLNISGGAVNLASATYYLYVIRPEVFDFIGGVVATVDVADGTSQTITVPIPGARKGDHALAKFGADLAGMSHSVNIENDDEAKVIIWNRTGAAYPSASVAVSVGVMLALG